MSSQVSYEQALVLAQLYKRYLYHPHYVSRVLEAYCTDPQLTKAMIGLMRKFSGQAHLSTEEQALIDAYTSLVERYINSHYRRQQ